jgi:hypothetical protein
MSVKITMLFTDDDMHILSPNELSVPDLCKLVDYQVNVIKDRTLEQALEQVPEEKRAVVREMHAQWSTGRL